MCSNVRSRVHIQGYQQVPKKGENLYRMVPDNLQHSPNINILVVTNAKQSLIPTIPDWQPSTKPHNKL